jgi:urease subunit gamma/beta
VHLSPKEIEKLMLHQAGVLAQKRFARGLALNYVETMALLASQLLEFIREGRSVAELMDLGKHMLGQRDVMPGVAAMVHEVQVEGTFPDGTKLVTVHDPICLEEGQPELALHGSGLTRQSSPPLLNSAPLIPGESMVAEGELELNVGRQTLSLTILNTGDRPIQVGSHYPFMESNRALQFDRRASYGYRLNIPAGTAVRFEPGESKKVSFVEFAGHKIYKGGNAQVDGQAKGKDLDTLMEQMKSEGFQFCEELS